MNKIHTGVKLNILDNDKMFTKITNPIIINKLPAKTDADRERISNRLISTYENNDVLSNIPTCACGTLTRGYNLGRICSLCDTVVSSTVNNKLEFKAWFKVPDGIPGFIIPEIWLTLSLGLSSKTGYNLMEYLTNEGSTVPENTSKIMLTKINTINQAGFPRGLTNFINNIDWFINLLPALKMKNCKDTQLMLREYKDIMFPRYLPLPAKATLVIERIQNRDIADTSINGVFKAILIGMNLSANADNYNIKRLEKETMHITKNISEYLMNTMTGPFSQKRGYWRGHVFGYRSNFSSRSVITSIHEPHHYREVHLPWSLSVEMLKPQLMSKLYALNYSELEVVDIIYQGVNVPSDLLKQLFKELILESANPIGIPVVLQRNPTMETLSAQSNMISRIKTDPDDKSFSISPLGLKGYKGDIDGDELNLILDIGYLMVDSLAPHNSLHSLTSPKAINSAFDLPDNTIASLDLWLESEIDSEVVYEDNFKYNPSREALWIDPKRTLIEDTGI